MALIDENSQQVPLAEFEMFAAPQTQVVVKDDLVTEHRPLSILDSEHPLEFIISSAPDEYVNFRETLLYLKMYVKLSKKNNTDMVAMDWEKITPVNNLLHSLWESVEIKIGDTQVNNPNSTYAYRAYFDALFNSGPDAQKTYMKAAYFDSSEANRRKPLKPDTTSGKISKSNVIDLGGRIHTDLTFQDRAILGGSEIRIKLNPHNPNFYFQTTDANLNVEVVFEEAHLEVHRSKVYDPIVVAHSEALKYSMAKYPINRMEVKQYTINSGTIDTYIDNAINGQLPHRIYVGLVKNSSFHGTLTSDPFKFEPFNIDYLVSYYNANQVPSKPYKPDFENKNFMREYLGLFATSNQFYCEPKCIITKDMFENGTTLFGFNYSPDLSDDCNSSGHTSLIKRGTLRLEMHFKAALTETVTVLVFAEYDNIVRISAERNGVTDFN